MKVVSNERAKSGMLIAAGVTVVASFALWLTGEFKIIFIFG